MITAAKIIKPEEVYETNRFGVLTDLQRLKAGRRADWYVEVIFHDGTFVALNEEELRNAAGLAEKGCLSD